MALWPNWPKFFRSFQNNSVCDRKSPKKQVETQSREMFLIFRTTLLVVRCMIAVPLVATLLYFMQSNPWFSLNWFNLAKMVWAVEQTPMLRQHNSPVVFVSWLANLQHKINWTSSEIFVVSSSYIPNNCAFFNLSRICFNKSSEIWRHLRLVVLLNSGIFLTLETAFFVHGDGFFSSMDNFFLEILQRIAYVWLILMSRMLWPHTFFRRPGDELLLSNRLYETGNALKDTVSPCAFGTFFVHSVTW